MTLDKWLAQRGRAAQLAKALGRSKQAVSLWRRHGPPLGLIPSIAEATGEQVTADEMLRDKLRKRTTGV